MNININFDLSQHQPGDTRIINGEDNPVINDLFDDYIECKRRDEKMRRATWSPDQQRRGQGCVRSRGTLRGMGLLFCMRTRKGLTDTHCLYLINTRLYADEQRMAAEEAEAQRRAAADEQRMAAEAEAQRMAAER